MNKVPFNVKKVLILLGIAVLPLIIFCFSYAFRKGPAADNRLLLNLIMGGIDAVHYSPRPVDNTLSENIFNEYLKRVDYGKKIFTQKDVDRLKKYRTSVDEELRDSSYEFFDAVMTIYYERIVQAYRYSQLPLQQPLSFSNDENIETDGDKLSFATDSNALKEAWRKYMKLQVLQQLYEEEQLQQKAKEKSDTVNIKSFTQLEEIAREKVTKSNEEFWERIHSLEYNDWLAAYLDCIANIEDPHTEYFPPVAKQNFDIQISGQLEGIGAQLQEREGEIRIASIVPGSASWKQGILKPGDVILKVAQGANEPVNVEGMRLDKAIQLIRGKKGTEVRLTVRKPDGSILVVPIIRDIVVIEATYAQAAIINIKDRKVGYLRLPEFYTPVEQRTGGRSSADDMRKELIKLKEEKVSAIILDLRDNGGGSLQEAVDITGLFISMGPVVQVRARDEQPRMLHDLDPDIIYDGPLTIMVNENSASASEIVAAAMQDYRRAVVIGSRNTFGKGTVQNFYNLDNFVAPSGGSKPSYGSVKITIQKYYRVNGGSTQLRGVTSDIILPDPYSEIPYGEKEDPFAIPWDEISPAKFNPVNVTFDLASLRTNSENRILSNPAFQIIKEQAGDFKERNENTTYPLNYKKFVALQEGLSQKEKKYESIVSDSALVNVVNLNADLTKINADSTSIARNNQFLNRLRKDIYLHETIQVMAEMK